MDWRKQFDLPMWTCVPHKREREGGEREGEREREREKEREVTSTCSGGIDDIASNSSYFKHISIKGTLASCVENSWPHLGMHHPAYQISEAGSSYHSDILRELALQEKAPEAHPGIIQPSTAIVQTYP